jgi:methylase of polypeptide subunit release factors
LKKEISLGKSIFSLQNNLNSNRSPLICLEIGCGSGFVSASLQQCLFENDWQAYQILTDINDKAASIAFQTMSKNDISNVSQLEAMCVVISLQFFFLNTRVNLEKNSI